MSRFDLFFVVLDESLHRELFGGSAATQWSCLYLHESSTEKSGHELSGSLSLLCDRLAAARVPVLNVTTLARNFMLVQSSVAELALSTLRAAVEAYGCVAHVVTSAESNWYLVYRPEEESDESEEEGDDSSASAKARGRCAPERGALAAPPPTRRASAGRI